MGCKYRNDFRIKSNIQVKLEKMSMPLRWLFLIVLGVFLVGCQKDKDVFIPNEISIDDVQGKVEDLLTNVSPQAETFQWDPSQSQTLFTKEGSRLTIPANAFMLLDGTSDLTGLIQIKIQEVMYKGDMIRFRLPATSGGQLMETFGALHISAEMDGQPLALKAGVSIDWDIPTDNFSGDLNLFYGLESQVSDLEWVGATEVFSNQTPVRPVKILTPEGESLNAYKAQPQQLGWWSCSRFVAREMSGEESLVAIELSELFDEQNSAVFLVFEERRTVIPLFYDEIEGDSQFSSPLVPVGEDIIVVAIAEGTQGRSFMGFETLRTERPEQTLTLPLFQRSLHTIELFLDSL